MTLQPAVVNKAFQDGYKDAYSRELFRAFRQTFVAEHLADRVMFWADLSKTNGRVVVRQVKDLQRVRKGTDTIVGMTDNNLSEIRILIGNYAAGCKLTTLRWELYGDFACTELFAKGRFDYDDLAGSIPLEERKNLIARGIYPRGDWDFDGILLTHRCPLCGGVFDRTSLLYVSSRPCENCGQVVDMKESYSVITKLLLAHQLRKQKITDHWELTQNGVIKVSGFVDPIANSVAFWPLDRLAHLTDFRNIFQYFGKHFFDDFQELYRYSLLKLILCKEFEPHFAACLRRITESRQQIIVNALKRVSERFSPLWLEECITKGLPATETTDLNLAVQVLPTLINDLILNHHKLNTIKRKETTK